MSMNKKNNICINDKHIGENKMEKKTNWFELMLALMDKASKEGHSELARELENLAYNHTPEVK